MSVPTSIICHLTENQVEQQGSDGSRGGGESCRFKNHCVKPPRNVKSLWEHQSDPQSEEEEVVFMIGG